MAEIRVKLQRDPDCKVAWILFNRSMLADTRDFEIGYFTHRYLSIRVVMSDG